MQCAQFSEFPPNSVCLTSIIYILFIKAIHSLFMDYHLENLIKTRQQDSEQRGSHQEQEDAEDLWSIFTSETRRSPCIRVQLSTLPSSSSSFYCLTGPLSIVAPYRAPPLTHNSSLSIKLDSAIRKASNTRKIRGETFVNYWVFCIIQSASFVFSLAISRRIFVSILLET